jgi:hypothetical protein
VGGLDEHAVAFAAFAVVTIEHAIDGILHAGGLAGQGVGDFVGDAQAQVEADEFQGEWREPGIAKLFPPSARDFGQRAGDGEAADVGFCGGGGGAGYVGHREFQ